MTTREPAWRALARYHGISTPPPPGSFGLSRIGGLTGSLIAAGQAFSGDGSRFTHAFVVLDRGEVIEAMPGGARIVPVADRLSHPEVVFCDAPVQTWLDSIRLGNGVMTPEHRDEYESRKREEIVRHARALEGTPYGYLQYPAIGLTALGLRPTRLKRFIADLGHLICSQLVDEVMLRSRLHLFDDGRLPQAVTPGHLDLYRVRALEAAAR